MAISPTCNRCGQELTAFGAILFSPPRSDETVKKYHLCVSCYNETIAGYKRPIAD